MKIQAFKNSRLGQQPVFGKIAHTQAHVERRARSCKYFVGIGRSQWQESVSYVLDRPAKDDKPLLAEAVERAREAVFCWIENGIETAMNKFNRVSE